LFAFVIVSAAVLILRITDPTTPRPFRVPAVWVVSTLGILVNGFMMYKLGPANWLRLLVWLVLGLGIFAGYSRGHSALRSSGNGDHRGV
jgi:APA family basic amino acid/polyamine antiporter